MQFLGVHDSLEQVRHVHCKMMILQQQGLFWISTAVIFQHEAASCSIVEQVSWTIVLRRGILPEHCWPDDRQLDWAMHQSLGRPQSHAQQAVKCATIYTIELHRLMPI